MRGSAGLNSQRSAFQNQVSGLPTEGNGNSWEDTDMF